ncbi:MAG: cytochrome P450 [Gammaproteobacteria bacterium]|nr:cytochrome P450 [Gammaproteobacteria bacterium]
MTFSALQAIKSLAVSALLIPERLRNGVTYNPFSDKVTQDPYPVYAELRERSPVHHSRLMDAIVVSRYGDVDRILRDHARFSVNPDLRTSRKARYKPTPEERSILFIDPPDHTRLRSLVNKAFTRSAINTLEPRIREIMKILLDDIKNHAGFDLMQAVAIPLPVIVIAEMLGIPQEDRAQFRVWSNQRARLLEPMLTRAERKTANEASKQLSDYFLSIIKSRQGEPRDDILTRLVQAEEQGDTLSELEMLNMLRLLLIAGNETTTNLIGNGMLALLRHPDQLQALRDDPGLIPAAVDELLRYDSPVQMTLRCAVEDCDIDGMAVRAGQDVILLGGSANRDPDAFENPDQLDFNRQKQDHISFGRDIHYCLGAGLERLEGRIAFEMLLERFDSLRQLTARAEFRYSIVLRGLTSLPVGV